MGFIIKPIITFVNICVHNDAKAAPITPINGISAALSITFIKAPDKLMLHKYFCLFSASIHMLRIGPRYEKVVYQTTKPRTPEAAL